MTWISRVYWVIIYYNIFYFFVVCDSLSAPSSKNPTKKKNQKIHSTTNLGGFLTALPLFFTPQRIENRRFRDGTSKELKVMVDWKGRGGFKPLVPGVLQVDVLNQEISNERTYVSRTPKKPEYLITRSQLT